MKCFILTKNVNTITYNIIKNNYFGNISKMI